MGNIYSYDSPLLDLIEFKMSLSSTSPYVVDHRFRLNESERNNKKFKKMYRPPMSGCLPRPGIEPGTFRSSV